MCQRVIRRLPGSRSRPRSSHASSTFKQAVTLYDPEAVTQSQCSQIVRAASLRLSPEHHRTVCRAASRSWGVIRRAPPAARSISWFGIVIACDSSRSPGVHASVSDPIFDVWHSFAKKFFRLPRQTRPIVASGNSCFSSVVPKRSRQTDRRNRAWMMYQPSQPMNKRISFDADPYTVSRWMIRNRLTTT